MCLLRVVDTFSRVKIAIGEARRDAPKLFFVGLVIFSLLYAEFIVAYTSPVGPMMGLTIFVDERGNEIENALGRFTVTDTVHFLVKGSGRYWFKVKDLQGNMIFSGSGRFNNSGYADVNFVLDPRRFYVGESYVVELFAVDEPLPMLFKWGKVTKEFMVSKELTRISLGFYKHPMFNKTVIFAKLTDESGGISGESIVFHWKRYGTNESFVYIGEGVTNGEGVAELILNGSESGLMLVKAEFRGGSIYEASAVDEVFTSVINAGKTVVMRSEGMHNSRNISKDDTVKKIEKAITSKGADSSNRKVAVSSLEVFPKFKTESSNDANDKKPVKTADDVPKVSFYDGDIEHMGLIEFLENLTTTSSPASILVDIAEILNNLNDLPYVVWKLGIIFSKLNIALVPAVDGNSIILYKVRVYEVVKNVAKTITKTVTVTATQWVKRTETVYKQVKDKVKELTKLVKWIRKKQVQTITYWNPLTWRWETIKRVYYVWVPKIEWKVIWKTVTKTVKETRTYWEKVTTTTTRTITLTVYEKVKKTVRENVKAYKIDVLSYEVEDLSNGETKRVDEWILSLVGINADVLKKTTGYLLQKTIGPALDIINGIVDFLVSWARRFLKDLADSFLDYIFSLVIASAAKESLSSSSSCSYKDKSSHTDYKYTGFYSMNRFLAKESNGKVKLSVATARSLKLARLRALTYALLGIDSVSIVTLTSHSLTYYKEGKNSEWKLDMTNMRNYEKFATSDNNLYFPLGLSKSYILGVTVMKDENGNIRYDADGVPIYGYTVAEVITVEGENAKFYDINYVKSFPRDLRREVENSISQWLNEVNIIRSKKGLNKISISDIETYGKWRSILSETFGVDFKSAIKDAIKYNGLEFDESKLSFGDKISPIQKQEYLVIEGKEVPKYPENAPIDEIALIKHDDGTETAVVGFKEFDERFLGYHTSDKTKINYARNAGSIIRDLLHIRLSEEETSKWRSEKFRNKILREYFDVHGNELLKEAFFEIKNIAENKNYKLDHLSGFSMLYSTFKISSDDNEFQVIVGHPDTYVGYYGNTFLVAPGQITPTFLVVNNLLATKYKKYMDSFVVSNSHHWSNNRKIVVLTEAVILNSLRIALLHQQNPNDILFNINGRKVSLTDLYTGIVGENNEGARRFIIHL